jgi:predicted ATP-dependent serine protease
MPGSAYCQRCGKYTSGDAISLRGIRATDVVPLSDVDESKIQKLSIGGTFDRAFGGGLAPGLIYVLTGEPGLGKTTLLLQKAPKFVALANRDKWVYFISAEQASGEVKASIKRLGLEHTDRILVLREFGAGGEIADELFKKYPPCFIIVDSISAMCGRDKEMAVKLAEQFKKYAVANQCPVFLIAHMNKQGDIAGMFTLQYNVDALAAIESPQNEDPRCYDKSASGGRDFLKLVVYKNRSGACRQAHWFEMTESGLKDVPLDYEKKWDRKNGGDDGEEPEPPRPSPPPPPPPPRKPSMARLPKDAIVQDGQKLVLKPKKPARAAAVEGEALKRKPRKDIGA